MSARQNLLEGLRVLIVEDHYLIAEDLAGMIRRMGGQVLGPAARLAGAITLLRNDHPDLALLDVNIGGERVYEVAEALQQASVPFAFTTGYDASAIDPRFRDLPYLEKPVSEAGLAETLAGMLRRDGGGDGR